MKQPTALLRGLYNRLRHGAAQIMVRSLFPSRIRHCVDHSFFSSKNYPEEDTPQDSGENEEDPPPLLNVRSGGLVSERLTIPSPAVITVVHCLLSGFWYQVLGLNF